jgi:hypothetical protein
VGGVTGFILIAPQARNLAWPTSVVDVANNKAHPSRSSPQPRARVVHDVNQLLHTKEHGGSTRDSALTNVSCATAWDYLHRNFSTGRRCSDCAMGNLSTNNDIAFIDMIVNAEASTPLDATHFTHAHTFAHLA